MLITKVGEGVWRIEVDVQDRVGGCDCLSAGCRQSLREAAGHGSPRPLAIA
jgi:hypothetical protein